jgi:hypothetical protein
VAEAGAETSERGRNRAALAFICVMNRQTNIFKINESHHWLNKSLNLSLPLLGRIDVRCTW